MKLFYIANVRMPTEKAHGIAIARACEAFGRANIETHLIVPNRRTPIQKSVFDAYAVRPLFTVRFLPTVDLIREKAGRFVFWLQTITFQISLIGFLMFKNREIILYTREPSLLFLKFFGFKVMFECHVIAKNKRRFFARARGAHRLVVISEALKRAFVDVGFSEESILVAPSGVDLSVFDIDVSKQEARKKLDLPLDAKIAVYTGNFTTMGEDKGIADIIRALTKASDIVFVAAGGAEHDRLEYVSQASAAGVLGRVILRGSTTQKMLALYQKAADVLVMPFPDTPHYRNHMSPVKMFEYMAAKRPIIASDLPTIREVLNESNAVIVKPGDAKELAAELEFACNDSAKSGVLAAAAYTEVSKYSWDARATSILKHVA